MYSEFFPMAFLFCARTFSPPTGITIIDVLIRSKERNFIPEHTVYYSCKTRSGKLYFIPGSQLWDIHCAGEISDDSPSELKDLIIRQAIEGIPPIPN
jgi:hypothetical protein